MKIFWLKIFMENICLKIPMKKFDWEPHGIFDHKSILKNTVGIPEVFYRHIGGRLTPKPAPGATAADVAERFQVRNISTHPGTKFSTTSMYIQIHVVHQKLRIRHALLFHWVPWCTLVWSNNFWIIEEHCAIIDVVLKHLRVYRYHKRCTRPRTLHTQAGTRYHGRLRPVLNLAHRN
jgi:hypothetical protein